MALDRNLTADALRSLLDTNLRRGHRRIAIRHWLMLRRLRAELPHSVEHRVAQVRASIAPRDADRIERDVNTWAELVGLRPW